MSFRPKILVVDDAEEIRESFSAMLESMGYEAETAESGYEAVRKSRDAFFSLYLLDLNMPGMTGLETLEKLEIQKGPHAAIMITGEGNLKSAQKAMELGAFGYLSKTQRITDLEMHVKKALEMVQLREERIEHLRELEEQVEKRTMELREALQLAETRGNRLDAIISGMEEGLLAIDPDGTIMLINDKAADFLKISKSESVGSSLALSGTQGSPRSKLAEMVEDNNWKIGNFGDCQLSITHNDGEKHLLVRISSIKGEQGNSIGKIVVLVDRTDKILSERMRSSFLSIVSHELRTPVNIMTNYLACMRAAKDRAQTIFDAVDDMEMAGNRLTELVNNMINVANLSGPDTDFMRSEADIADILKRIEETFRQEADKRGIKIAVRNKAGERPALLDTKILQICLKSLVSNAIKFNKDFGKVVISTEVIEGDVNQFLSISVADQGKGIAKKDRKTLFEGFMQAEDPLTRKHGGTGTGLYLVRRAMEILNGSINLDSTPGKGTTITIKFPIKYA